MKIETCQMIGVQLYVQCTQSLHSQGCVPLKYIVYTYYSGMQFKVNRKPLGPLSFVCGFKLLGLTGSTIYLLIF